MKERSLGIILGILNIVLLTVCGIFFLGKDKNAPEILLPEGSIVYAEEAGTDSLVEGVTAFDEEDGELTGSVIIEKIVTDEAKETATITYGVADSSGNVGKVTCTVEMIVEDVSDQEINTSEAELQGQNASLDEKKEETSSEVENTEAEEESDSESDEESTEAEEESDSESDDESTEAEEESDNESDGENIDAEESDSESEDENTASDSESGEESETEEDNREALPTAGEAGNAGQSVTSKQEPGRPSIVFKKQEVYTTAGMDPAWVNVIEGLHDDKDNYETLLKSLRINGEYDRNTAGTYDITVTVKDSDGNESNSYPMKIIVE